MADNTSLFGGMMSPQEMQQQLIDQRALQFANLGQNQRLAMLGYKAGAGVGQGLGGLFGVDMTDPTIQRATKLREMASQYNTNTAAGLRQMAAAVQATDPDTAYKILQQANALEMNEAKLTTERATAAAKLSEKATEQQKNAAALADSQFDRGTPEWNKAYAENLKDLTTKPEKAVSFGAEAERTSLALYGKPFKDLTQAQQQEVNKKVDESAANKAPKVYNRIEGLDKAITAVTGKAVGEEIAALGKSVSGLAKFERAVSDVEALLPNSFTGLGSGALTQLNKAASAMGLSKGEKASNTEILTNTFNNIVLPMARQLPGSLAAKELTFLLTTKPATEQEMPTIRRLMRQMLQDYRDDKAAYEAAQKHQAANRGSYEGFDINAARYNAGRVSDLTQRVKSGTATLEEAMELKQLRSTQR